MLLSPYSSIINQQTKILNLNFPFVLIRVLRGDHVLLPKDLHDFLHVLQVFVDQFFEAKQTFYIPESFFNYHTLQVNRQSIFGFENGNDLQRNSRMDDARLQLHP